ncbi:MAG: Fur family transcriptional regulator [Deltaproteobacteria bacterium]|nr:Fur family transcriptional regulator [Deltaproteobacteria bacterium]
MEKLTREGLIGKLEERGLKITPQRLAIVDVLVEKGYLHPGAKLIYREARRRTRNVSLSTVYATLGEFVQQGIIKNLEFDRMENRCEVTLEEHINLVCRRCGKITDFHLPPSIEPGDIARRVGFTVTDARMEYYGYCRDCVSDREDFPGKRKRQGRKG